jgi:hypothetical protein
MELVGWLVVILAVKATSTGRFIMFSMITNIYNKKTKGCTLMELFTATGLFLVQLEMIDLCTAGGTAHINTIFKFLPQTLQHVFSFPLAVNNSIKVGPLVFLL